MGVKSSYMQEELCNRLDKLYVPVYVGHMKFIDNKICFKTCFVTFYCDDWEPPGICIT